MSIKLNEFLFYKIVVFLTSKHRLKWSIEGSSIITAQPTRELTIEVRYYDNGTSSDVMDFKCKYSYHDVNHELVRKTISLRFREREVEHKLFSFKRFYEIAMMQALSEGHVERISVLPYELLNEYSSVYQFNHSLGDEDLAPFDGTLMIKMLQLALD